jgi:hypothetical protein
MFDGILVLILIFTTCYYLIMMVFYPVIHDENKIYLLTFGESL